MAVLKDYAFKNSSCEVEFIVENIDHFDDGESVDLKIVFRFGEKFPIISGKVVCLKDDLLSVCYNLKNLSATKVEELSTNDPGITIYSIPSGRDHPNFYSLYKMIFELDAGEVNQQVATESGPSLILISKPDQVNEFALCFQEELE